MYYKITKHCDDINIKFGKWVQLGLAEANYGFH